MKGRDNAPHTPRVILLGPPGSGKSVQASLLSSKYELVHGMFLLYIYISSECKKYVEVFIVFQQRALLHAIMSIFC